MRPKHNHLPSVPTAFKELNGQQVHFLTALIEAGGGHQHGPQAALEAGYGTTHEDAARAARILLKSPKILRALRDAVMHRFDVAATLAVATITEICGNQKAPASARLTAALEILNRSIGPIASRNFNVSANVGISVEDWLEALDARQAAAAAGEATEILDVTPTDAEDQEE